MVTEYQSVHFCPKLRALMLELNVFIKKEPFFSPPLGLFSPFHHICTFEFFEKNWCTFINWAYKKRSLFFPRLWGYLTRLTIYIEIFLRFSVYPNKFSIRKNFINKIFYYIRILFSESDFSHYIKSFFSLNKKFCLWRHDR